MKFYRVSFTVNGADAGRHWTTNRKEAGRILAAFVFNKSRGDDGVPVWGGGEEAPEYSGRVDSIEIHPTRAGILAALNEHASAPEGEIPEC